MAKHFLIKQLRSATGRLPKHILTVRGLGLRRVGHSVEIVDTPQVRGMIEQVQYLISVTAVEGALKKEAHPKRHERRVAEKKKKSA